MGRAAAFLRAWVARLWNEPCLACSKPRTPGILSIWCASHMAAIENHRETHISTVAYEETIAALENWRRR